MPWNGLSGVEDAPTGTDVQAFYLDGVKYLQTQSPADYSGKLKAFTYPEEFDEILGIEEVVQGLSYHDQQQKSFGLSYRTRIGNDTDGVDHGYRIHVLYNLLAVPDSTSFDSVNNSPAPAQFSWALSGTPPLLTGRRSTVHISIDSRRTDPQRLEGIESVLYGTDTTAPVLPELDDFTVYFEQYDALTIVDHGDGTWTAIDPADAYVTMTDPTTFSITADGAIPIDTDSYTLSTTEP